MAGKFGCSLKSPKGGEGGRCLYPDRLDVYGKGCQHDCRYCYANPEDCCDLRRAK